MWLMAIVSSVVLSGSIVGPMHVSLLSITIPLVVKIQKFSLCCVKGILPANASFCLVQKGPTEKSRFFLFWPAFSLPRGPAPAQHSALLADARLGFECMTAWSSEKAAWS